MHVMEGITFSLKVAILALVTLSGRPGTALQFHCDTPDEWLARPASIYPGQLWPNGTVAYELHTSLTSSDVTEIHKAFSDIEKKTCIRFVPRPENETSYVSIEHDDDTCGVAHVCRTGGYQFARFGGGCVFANVMIHELGHTLCLGHEQTRKDRDDFVHFDPCGEGEVPGRDDFETRGHFYDYTSQMHYQCGWCPGGWPKMEGVSQCGMDVQEGMSVLDADKINDFYDCQECLSHRWRRTETLTDAEKDELVSFGKTGEGKDVYLCRTYVGTGEVAPGQYNLDNNTCTVTFNGTEYQVKDKVQVFTVPDEDSRIKYRMTEWVDNFVSVGRTQNGVTIYAAIAENTDSQGRYELIIGKLYEDDFSKAYFPVGHTEIISTNFFVMGCH